MVTYISWQAFYVIYAGIILWAAPNHIGFDYIDSCYENSCYKKEVCLNHFEITEKIIFKIEVKNEQ